MVVQHTIMYHRHHQEAANTQLSCPADDDDDDERGKEEPNGCQSNCHLFNQRAGPCFFQLAGHKECFREGLKPGTILKKSTGNEADCLNQLITDELAPFVPKVIGTIELAGECYLEMEDLLTGFKSASVMDIKMGCRTYREEELYTALREAKLRRDMFDKMVEVDKNEPTDEEKKVKAITKPRYMIWRETVSSTANLGFRIEGMRLTDGTVDKEFKTIKDEEQIAKALTRYAQGNKIRLKYLNRLYDLRQALTKSTFFSNHELIGSSLLFVHDDNEANIWLIDFAKTYKLPDNMLVTHLKKWELGNHEDGYLTGIDNLIRILELIISRTNDQFSSAICHHNNQATIRVKPEEKIMAKTITTTPAVNNGNNATAKHQAANTMARIKLNSSLVSLKETTTRFLRELIT